MAAAAGPCGPAVELRLVARLWQPSAGGLALAVLLGLGLGGGAAALLWLGALRPRLRRRKRDDSQRLVEGNRSAAPEHQGEEFPLPEMEETETWPVTEKEDQPPLDTHLTEFALKAKVIYPINQKFRPLADGSSNPSLHNSPKQAALPHQILEGSTSSSLESLSQGAKEECASSTTVHSAASEDRCRNQTLLKVSFFPELLTCDTFDVKMCLYSLFLKHLQLLDTELRKQKHVAVLQILRMSHNYLKKKIPEDLYQSILHTQETAFEELQTLLSSRLLNMEFSGARETEYQTLDDLERNEKGYADHVLDNMEAFWQTTDRTLLFLLDPSKGLSAKSKKILMRLTEAMISVEESFEELQDTQVTAIQERMFNWEQLVKFVGLLKTQIQEESKCRLHALSHALDQLIRRSLLTVKQKEELLTGIQKAFGGKVELYADECVQQGKKLVQKCLLSHAEKTEHQSKVQEDEQGTFLSRSWRLKSLDAFLKAFCEMSERQRKARCKLEEESDCEAIEAAAELYKKLYSRYSRSLEGLVVELFHQTLPVLTRLPLEECQLLKDNLQEYLGLHLEKSESHKQRLWTFFQEEMQQEQKLWMEERSFSAVIRSRLSETNEKTLQCVMARLGGLSKASSKYVTKKHRYLLKSVLRRLALRQVSLSILAQMRTSRRRNFILELKEHRFLQQSSSHCFDEHQWRQFKETESHIVDEEEKLDNEMHQTRLELHQLLVAETQESLRFLQQHLERVIGHALVQRARQLAAKHDTDGEEDVKEMLKEAAAESVYMTRHRGQRLLKDYSEQVAKSQGSHAEAAQKAFQQRTECRSHRRKWYGEEGNQPGPLNPSLPGWERTTKRVWAWFDVHQQARLVSLRRKMLRLNHLETQLENELRAAEQQFVRDLSAAVRLPLPAHRRPLESAARSGRKLPRLDPQSQEREEEEEEELVAKAVVAPGQVLNAISYKSQSRQEEEVGCVKIPEKLLEKRCKNAPQKTF